MRVPTHRQLAPLGLSGFRYLFFSTLGSSLGTLLAGIALAIDVKDRTNSGLWVGAVLVVEFLPTILVGLFLGPLLDRLERRSLMIASDLLRAAVFVALPFAGNAATIVGLALVAGLATGFFRPAVYAGVPNLVPEEQLAEANAIIQTVENASWAVGPVLGGLLTAAAGPSAAYWINAVSFVISAVLIRRIPPRLLQSETAAHARPLARPRRRVRRRHALAAAARRPRRLGDRVARHRRRQRGGDLPRQEHVQRGRLRLRPALQRDRRRARRRQRDEQRRARPLRHRAHVRAAACS